MKKKLALFLSVFCIISGLMVSAFALEDSGVEKNLLIFHRYNLSVKIPPSWVSLPVQDPHFVVSLASNEQPTIKDTRYSIFVAELKEGLTLSELMDRSAKGRAYQTAQRNLIKLGSRKKLKWQD